jgi:hypothetical protein
MRYAHLAAQALSACCAILAWQTDNAEPEMSHALSLACNTVPYYHVWKPQQLITTLKISFKVGELVIYK